MLIDDWTEWRSCSVVCNDEWYSLRSFLFFGLEKAFSLLRGGLVICFLC